MDIFEILFVIMACIGFVGFAVLIITDYLDIKRGNENERHSENDTDGI